MGLYWKLERTFCVSFCGFQIKMSLQLYQVDHKSYLLDFKSLSEEATNPVVEERRERLLGRSQTLVWMCEYKLVFDPYGTRYQQNRGS